MDDLAPFGVTPVNDRVLIDGHYVTAAGVSAGIDMALTLTGRIAGDAAAQSRQLSIEYAPEPPYDAGSPASAPTAVVQDLVRRRQQSLTGEVIGDMTATGWELWRHWPSSRPPPRRPCSPDQHHVQAPRAVDALR